MVHAGHWGRLGLLCGATLLLAAASMDSWITVKSTQKLPNNTLTRILSLNDDTAHVTETFGIFTAKLKGAASNAKDYKYFNVDCKDGLLGTLFSAQTKSPSDACQNECHTKKAFIILAVLFAWYSLSWLTEHDGHPFGYAKNASTRWIGFVMLLCSFVSGIIVIGLFAHEKTQKGGISDGAGLDGLYEKNTGICAYDLGKADGLIITDTDGNEWGPSAWCAWFGTACVGIATAMVFATAFEPLNKRLEADSHM